VKQKLAIFKANITHKNISLDAISKRTIIKSL
jgi:hypothetical protein